MASRRHNSPIPEEKIDAGARALLKLSRGSDKVGHAVMRGARASAEVVLLAAHRIDHPEEPLEMLET